MIALLAALLAPANAAEGIAGLAWAPLSRGDLVWVADERTTGTGVGEFDGSSRPNLAPFGGVWWKRTALVGSLGVARISTSSRSGGVVRNRHWGVIRPSLDVRYALLDRQRSVPIPWLVAGVAGSIPSARDSSNAFSDLEQEEADRAATVDRTRLGGLGARLGAGIDLEILPHLSIGGEFALEAYTSALRSSELVAVTTTIGSRGALLLTFGWGPSDQSP